MQLNMRRKCMITNNITHTSENISVCYLRMSKHGKRRMTFTKKKKKRRQGNQQHFTFEYHTCLSFLVFLWVESAWTLVQSSIVAKKHRTEEATSWITFEKGRRTFLLFFYVENQIFYPFYCFHYNLLKKLYMMKKMQRDLQCNQIKSI